MTLQTLEYQMWRYPYFVIGFIVLTVLTLGLLRTVYAEDPVAVLIPYAIFIVADIVLTLVLTRGRKHKLLDDRVEVSGLTGRTTVEYSDIQEAIVTHTALSFRIGGTTKDNKVVIIRKDGSSVSALLWEPDGFYEELRRRAGLEPDTRRRLEQYY